MITALLARDFLQAAGEQGRDDRLRPALQPRGGRRGESRRRRAAPRARRACVHQEDDGRNQGRLRRRALGPLLFPRQFLRRLRRDRLRPAAVGAVRPTAAAQRTDRPADRYSQSGEINFQVEDKDGKIRELADAYKKAQIDYLDGITIDLGDWWFNVRKSNTEPLLRLNLEAETPQLLDEKLKELQKILGEPVGRTLSMILTPSDPMAAGPDSDPEISVRLDRRLDRTFSREENQMPTFMFQGCYTSASMAALLKKPEDRTAVVRGLIESLGGKLEGFWLSFGEHDFVGIAQLPDSQAAAAFAMDVSASGALRHFKTIELLKWEDGVKAMKKASGLTYRPPTEPAN